MRTSRRLPVLSSAVLTRPVEPDHTFSADIGGAEEEQSGLSAHQLYGIVRAHRVATIAIFFAVVVPTALVAKFVLPKTYAATATLMVNYEINNPLARRDTDVGILTNFMSTRIQLMRSAEVLKPVIERLHLTDDPEFTRGFRGDPSALPEYVSNVLSANLDIEQGAFGSQLLTVSAFARSPVRAAQIANAVSEVYADLELRRQTGPATDRALRYSQQLTELKKKVDLAQEQVTQFRQRNGILADPSSQGTGESELLTTLEQRYQEAQNQRRAAEVKSAGNQSTSNAFLTSNMVQQLKTKIVGLEAQLAQMTQTLGANHPKVKELQSELDATRSSLDAESRNYSSSADTDLLSARQLEEKMRVAVAEQRAKVLNARRLQDEAQKYILEFQSAESVYKRAMDGYDEIMFAAGAHATDVNFVSRAVPPLKAAKPNNWKILFMSIIAGLGLGIAGPLARELLLNRLIRCRDDLERSFKIPVLIELDEIPSASRPA